MTWEFTMIWCWMGLHHWVIQGHSIEDDAKAFHATGSILPVQVWCRRCGKVHS